MTLTRTTVLVELDVEHDDGTPLADVALLAAAGARFAMEGIRLPSEDLYARTIGVPTATIPVAEF